MPLNLFYTMVQKRQKWRKTQIKGGPALNRLRLESNYELMIWSFTPSLLLHCQHKFTCDTLTLSVFSHTPITPILSLLY